MDKLIELLLAVNNDSEIEQVQLAVVAAAQNVESEKTASGKILTALENTNKKERFISILPEIGGDVALETVAGYFKNSSGSVKETAFEALTHWKDYAASKELFEIEILFIVFQ